MGRDADRDHSGDQAAWRDLVARLELPSPVDPANPPWPERENLRRAAHARRDGDATDHRAGRHRDVSGQPGTGKDPESVGQPDAPRDSSTAAESDQNARTSASRGRVIRPARSARFFVPADEQAPGVARRQTGPADIPGLRSFPPAISGLAPGWSFGPVTGPAGEKPAGEKPAGEIPVRDVYEDPTSPDLGPLDWDELDDNADERYVPPLVPPQPKLDPVARGAWTALFGGPGYLFIATTLGWQVPGWAELAAIIAFITAFVVLVSRLGNGPSRRDGPDQGAVV